MPRIAHVISTPSGIGGAEHVLEALCEGGRERGWEQMVLNPFARDPDTADLRDHIADARYSGKRVENSLHLPAVRSWLGHELATAPPDLVHVHLFHAAAITASLRGLHPRVLTHHHGDYLEIQGRGAEIRIDRWAGKRYDRVVAVSEAVSTFLQQRYGYSAERVSTIVNGWSGTPVARRTEGAPPTIVSVGNLRPEKGHDRLLRAFALVSGSRPEVRLRMLGEGPERERLEALSRELNIVERVDWLGQVDPPWDELSRARVFATASRAEPLGIAALEAMAAGLPVVATRVGGLVELVDDGVTGFLVPSGDDAAMATALDRLLADEQSAERMGRAGAVAADSYRAEDMVASYFELYGELI